MNHQTSSPTVADDKTTVYNRDASLSALNSSLSVLARRYSVYAGKMMDEEGVTHTMSWPLVMMGRLGDGFRLSTLAKILCIEGPSLVRTIDQLVDAGFVERTEDPADRRAKMLSLTPKGKAACERIEVKLHSIRTIFYKDVSDQDIQACLRVFDVLSQNLGISVPEIPEEPVGDLHDAHESVSVK